MIKNATKSKIVKVGNKSVGEGNPTFFIAEIGNNHNGDFYLAKRTIEAASRAGADAVKFQKRFISETFTKELRDKPQAKDQVLGETYGQYREALELNVEEFKKLKEYAEELGLIFFATPFDLKSVDFLEEINQEIYKIASFDVTNLPLIEKVAKLGKPIILSSGMVTLEELDEAVELINKFNDQLIILYCISIYPTPDEHMNLATFDHLQERYPHLPVGYSGHEQDILASLTTVARGAHCIERHFTLDKNLPGPDHATVSINPDEFKEMVDKSRRMETFQGVVRETVHEIEQKTRDKHSKSITALVDIPKGTTITPEMVGTKSPGYGLKPNQMDMVIGCVCLIDISADTTLTGEELE